MTYLSVFSSLVPAILLISNEVINISSFLDGEMKNVMKDRKVLENKRLDLDASKSKVKKSRKELMEQRAVSSHQT